MKSRCAFPVPLSVSPLVAAVTLLALASGHVCPAAEPPPAPIKAFCLDFNWGPGGPNAFPKPGAWADASPAAQVEWCAGLGCNVIQTFAVSCNGYAWYKGGTVPAQPGLTSDFLPEVVRLAHARGLRVMGYFCIGANTRWGLARPDLSYGAPSSQHIPLTTNYLAYLSQAIAESLRLSGMDGFMIDWVFNPAGPTRWLACEQSMYTELLGEPFPGKDKVTAAQDLAYRRKAIERTWAAIRSAARGVKPDCVIWLSCHNLASPEVAGSSLFREVDWLMNENTDPQALAAVDAIRGPHTRLVQCMAGWGGKHDTRLLFEESQRRGYGFYGFAKPREDGLLLPIAEYRAKPVIAFTGNDRNVAVLMRAFNGLPLEEVSAQEPGGGFTLLPAQANAQGNSPVFVEGQIGHWENRADAVYWVLDVRQPGRFLVELDAAVAAGAGGSTLAVAVAGTTNVVTSVETGTWRDYRITRVGAVDLPAGRSRLVIQPSTSTPWHAISLRAVRLRREAAPKP